MPLSILTHLPLIESSGESPVSVRKFDRSRDVEKHVRSLPSVILPVHHVMLLSLVFGIIVCPSMFVVVLGCMVCGWGVVPAGLVCS